MQVCLSLKAPQRPLVLVLMEGEADGGVVEEVVGEARVVMERSVVVAVEGVAAGLSLLIASAKRALAAATTMASCRSTPAILRAAIPEG